MGREFLSRRRGVLGAATLAVLAAVAAMAQPDLGPAPPPEPPVMRYAVAELQMRLTMDLRSLERARRAATRPQQPAVDAAIALRRVVLELAAAGAADRDAAPSDLVLAAAIEADLPAWDAFVRRAIDEPAIAAGLVGMVASLDRPGPPRPRLASAAAELIAAAAVAAGLDPPSRSAPTADDPVAAGAALDRAIAAAGWLGRTDGLLEAHRRGAVGPGGAAVLRRAAAVIEACTAIEPQARRRARLRAAVDRLAAVWPPEATPEELAEVDRGWRRLEAIVEAAARRRGLAGRVAPAGLAIELRRLTGLLVERAEAAELAALDRVEDLLLGPGPTRDPALVTIVVGLRQAVEHLDLLHRRADWLAAVARIDASLEMVAGQWIDEQLLQLGAPTMRIAAARRLDAFASLLERLTDPPGLAQLEDPAADDRATFEGRGEQVLAAVRLARREQLVLRLGAEAGPEAASLDRWLDALAFREALSRARARLAAAEAAGVDPAATHPDWHLGVPPRQLLDEASRAVAMLVSRGLDAAGGGGPPLEVLSIVRPQVALVGGWLAAAEAPAAADLLAIAAATSLPPSMLAAVRPPSMPELAAVGVHAIEAAAARRADDLEAAEAHAATARWHASVAFDPSRTPRPVSAAGSAALTPRRP